MPKLGHK